MKKIGILTLGLKDNYGGILQAIALYCFIKKNNYKVVLIRKYPIESPIKKFIKKILEIIPVQNIHGVRVSNMKYQNNLKFWSQYIDCQTPIFTHKKQIEKYINNNVSCVVVGSDQVWRYAYINDREYDTYFLNFKLNKNINKIAYAASFGIDKWEAPEYSKEIKHFLNDFDFISVREESGIDICAQTFNISNVACVLDPTLLVGSKFFVDMIKDEHINLSDSVNYILDKSEKKNQIIDAINKYYNNKNIKELLTKSSILSIPEWVANFNTTKMVITDSFHGMVFSILFEKEFFVIINKNRGSDRFFSLCQKLDIMDRLISGDEFEIDFTLVKPLNYERINKKLSELREKSSDLLLNALKQG